MPFIERGTFQEQVFFKKKLIFIIGFWHEVMYEFDFRHVKVAAVVQLEMSSMSGSLLGVET